MKKELRMEEASALGSSQIHTPLADSVASSLRPDTFRSPLRQARP